MTRIKHISSPNEFECLADSYVESATGRMTITGLALAMGFRNRASIYDYQRRPEYTRSIARARLMIKHPKLISVMVGPCRCDDDDLTHLLICSRRGPIDVDALFA